MYRQQNVMSMCGSRKYPYPPHGRDFSYDPSPPSGFSKIGSQDRPPLPSGNSILASHPLEILSFLVETKNKLFFSARYRILIFIFFSRKTVSNTLPEGMSPRICDMKIIDLIPSIPLHKKFRQNSGY